MSTPVRPALADEHYRRLDQDAVAAQLAELERLAGDPLRALGSGVPTPRPAAAQPVQQAA